MKRTLILVSFSLILVSCSKDNQSIKALSWMEGNWTKIEETPTESIEVWKTVSENEMKGFGLTTENGDTIFYEKLSIISDQNKLFYLADIGAGEIRFELKEATENKWVFENPNHDFPKRIIYTREGELMVAYAEADKTSIPFRFKKTN